MINRWFRQVLMFAVIACLAAPTLAQDCSDAQAVLKEAQAKYNSLNLPEALDLLKTCQEAGWPGWSKNETVEALRLIAIVYFLTNRPGLARLTVADLLRIDADFNFTEHDPRALQDMVVHERRELEEYNQRKKFFIIGGSATALIGGVFIAVLSGGKSKKLPGIPEQLHPPRPGSK